MIRVLRFPGAREAAEACAERILEVLAQAVRERGVASLAVSGGSTPRPMFAAFARAAAEGRGDWTRVHLFWVDERCVPPSDEQSNFRLAAEAWLGPARVPRDNVHRVRTELPPAEAAAQYQEELRTFFHPDDGAFPRFDAIHLGMGADGHTASLFPGSPLVEDRAGWTAAVWVPKMPQWRVTLLPGAITAARDVFVLAAGADKAEVLAEVLGPAAGPGEPEARYPARIAAREGVRSTWFVDHAAAARLR